MANSIIQHKVSEKEKQRRAERLFKQIQKRNHNIEDIPELLMDELFTTKMAILYYIYANIKITNNNYFGCGKKIASKLGISYVYFRKEIIKLEKEGLLYREGKAGYSERRWRVGVNKEIPSDEHTIDYNKHIFDEQYKKVCSDGKVDRIKFSESYWDALKSENFEFTEYKHSEIFEDFKLDKKILPMDSRDNFIERVYAIFDAFGINFHSNNSDHTNIDMRLMKIDGKLIEDKYFWGSLDRYLNDYYSKVIEEINEKGYAETKKLYPTNVIDLWIKDNRLKNLRKVA